MGQGGQTIPQEKGGKARQAGLRSQDYSACGNTVGSVGKSGRADCSEDDGGAEAVFEEGLDFR
jgi:hypothetical protein